MEPCLSTCLSVCLSCICPCLLAGPLASPGHQQMGGVVVGRICIVYSSARQSLPPGNRKAGVNVDIIEQ